MSLARPRLGLGAFSGKDRAAARPGNSVQWSVTPPGPRHSVQCLGRGLSITGKRGIRCMAAPDSKGMETFTPEGMKRVLFVECGFGCDQHGQDVTSAAVRACRNAIEFNSIPCIKQIVPGGYSNMKLRLVLGCPPGFESALDLEKVKAVFPYGTMLPIEVKPGGLETGCGIAIEALGDKNDALLIIVAAVTVGY